MPSTVPIFVVCVVVAGIAAMYVNEVSDTPLARAAAGLSMCAAVVSLFMLTLQ